MPPPGSQMDFFGSQDRARGRTKLLIALYGLALLFIILAIHVVLVFAGFGAPGSEAVNETGVSYRTPDASDFLDPALFAMVAGGVILVVGGASLFKIRSLGADGAKVARSVGGIPVDPSTTDPAERKLLNIVEEMSIASGVPMPDVFVLPNEKTINAFAAGYETDNAAVAVTRGAIEQLSRDELQGVIAHEFSHVLSGDMRLNIRLIGPLFGLLVIAFLGRMFLYSGGGRGRGKGQGGIVILGLAIMAIGYIGVFFGRLIQAAISRQREYLADAAAVQFTRNPEGIGNALRRLGSRRVGSAIRHQHAEDTAHMFFAKALGSPFATHPPLTRRIREILPGWDGSYLPPREGPATDEPEPKPDEDVREGLFTAAAAVGSVGVLSQDSIRQGIQARIRIRRRLGAIEPGVPGEARNLVLALILESDETKRGRQLEWLRDKRGKEVAEAAAKNAEAVAPLSASDRYALLELCYPGLRKLDAEGRASFESLLEGLAREDESLSLREVLVLEAVHRQFHPDERGSGRKDGLERNVAKLSRPIGDLLHLIATVSEPNREKAADAFGDAVANQYLLSGHVTRPAKRMDLQELRSTLNSLARASFAIRKQVLTAAAEIVLRDERATDREWTLLRLISLSLGAPMPPAPGR